MFSSLWALMLKRFLFGLALNRFLHCQTIERMQSLEGKQFAVDDPYELTQFLRGELYILIDYCLSKSQHLCDSNTIRNLLEIYLAFFVSFLDVFTCYLKEVEKLTFLNHNNFTVN